MVFPTSPEQYQQLHSKQKALIQRQTYSASPVILRPTALLQNVLPCKTVPPYQNKYLGGRECVAGASALEEALLERITRLDPFAPLVLPLP